MLSRNPKRLRGWRTASKTKCKVIERGHHDLRRDGRPRLSGRVKLDYLLLASKPLITSLAIELHYTCNFVAERRRTMPLPETETPGRLQAELMSRGLRMTQQRRTILGGVETARQHLDASQILRRARKIDPGIDRVTVYRTLKLLKRYGLVDELDLMHLGGET